MCRRGIRLGSGLAREPYSAAARCKTILGGSSYYTSGSLIRAALILSVFTWPGRKEYGWVDCVFTAHPGAAVATYFCLVHSPREAGTYFICKIEIRKQ